jgi:hypothetical protein
MHVGPDAVDEASIHRLNFEVWSVETIFEIPGWAK